MTKEEFNLSEKAYENLACGIHFIKKDVKEFINKIRKMLYPSQIEELDKLAGDLKC